MAITFFPFGSLSDGTPVTAARMSNRHGACVTILDYGATIQSLLVPDKSGTPLDVVLGYDAAGLPTGRLLSVEGTAFDFREGKKLGRDIRADDEQLTSFGGYDHNYVLAGSRAAVLAGAKSGIRMAVETDLPGLQLYTSNMLDEQTGKRGSRMGLHSAVCLETQLFPNAMRLWGFPSPVLRTGARMCSETVYAFSVKA